jgi:hypothetical protein
VFIRRGEKWEKEYHDLEEYMTQVEDYYTRREFQTDLKSNRTVFLASDDPAVFDEAVKK